MVLKKLQDLFSKKRPQKRQPLQKQGLRASANSSSKEKSTGNSQRDKAEIEHYKKEIAEMIKKDPKAAQKAALIISSMLDEKSKKKAG